MMVRRIRKSNKGIPTRLDKSLKLLINEVKTKAKEQFNVTLTDREASRILAKMVRGKR